MTNTDIDPHSRFDPFLYKGEPIDRRRNSFGLPAAIIALVLMFGGIVWSVSGDHTSTASNEPIQTTGQGTAPSQR